MSGRLLLFAVGYLRAITDSVPESIPEHALRRYPDILAERVAYGDLFETIKAPLRNGVGGGLFRTDFTDQPMGAAYIDVLTTQAIQPAVLHGRCMQNLLYGTHHRLWCIVDVAKNECKALLSFDLTMDGQLHVTSLCLLHDAFEQAYHELLLILLVLYADARDCAIRLLERPHIDVIMLALGWLGFLEGNVGDLVRPRMRLACASAATTTAIRKQMQRLISECAANVLPVQNNACEPHTKVAESGTPVP